MKKAVVLSLFLLISYVSASQIEVTAFIFHPEAPQPGESVTILIRLTNRSYDKDAEVTCRLFVDGSLYDVKVVPVNRRSSSEVSFVWPAYPGEHEFSLEMSYYMERTEVTDTHFQYLEVPGTEEEIDYFSEALTLYQNGSYLQAKIMFEQAKRVFNEDQDIDSATMCEEYILRCDQYFQATQLYQQAEDFYAQEDFITALTYYQQAQSVYQLLEDDRASLCEERILEIREKQSKQEEPPYYLILLVPVVAAVIAAVWLIKRKPPPPLPDYLPEKKIGKEKPKRLFEEVEREGEIEGEKPEISEKLEKIESALDTESIQTFKSLVRDFKKQEIRFDKEEYTPEEAAYIERSLESVREKIKEKGKRLQDTKKLEDLREEVDALLNEPVGDLVDAYNKYARLHNVFDQIPDLQIQEQEDLKTKLKEYYEFIQQQAKSEQSQMQ